MMKKLLWCSAFLMTGFAASAQTTVELNPDKDNSNYSESSNSNGLGKLYSGQTCFDASRRAFLEFDIRSMVPYGATIIDVNLTLNMDLVSPGAGTQPYALHRVAKEWGEGSSFGTGTGAAPVAPDVTWADAMFETSAWDDAGGDFHPSPSSVIPVSDVLGDFSWSSPAMIINVQHWLDYPESNHGWILIGDEGATCNARQFGSKDEGISPILEITFTCAPGAPEARCNSVSLYLDAAGEGTITGEDLDGGSIDVCGDLLTYSSSLTAFNCDDISTEATSASMIISGVYDCTLSGGTPKGVEIYVINDIEDMSAYGIGFANNGGGTDGEEFTFPAESASAGTYFYISTEEIRFEEWFGFDPSFTDGSAAINGDDAIELFLDGTVIDVFGDIDTDGSGEPWEYLDGWAIRLPDTGLDGPVFDISHWAFSGPNALDGESSNAMAGIPVPIATYTINPTSGTVVTLTITDEDANTATCVTSVMIFDSLAPAMSCVGATTFVLDETGVVIIDASDIDAGTEDGCGIDTLYLSKTLFTCADEGENTVMLYATDIYGNTDSCGTTITIDASDVISITEEDLIDPTCFGFEDGSVNVNIVGGTPDFLFDWDNDGTGDLDDLEDLTGIGAGSYTIVVIDDNGCQATATFDLSEPDEITISTEITNESCPGANDGSIVITVSGGASPYDGDDDMVDLAGSDYSITIIDVNGCTAIFEVTVGIEDVIDLTITETDDNLTSNQDGGTYQWVACPEYTPIDGATEQTFVPEGFGSYAVIVTIDGGCTDTTACVEFGVDGIEEDNLLHVSLYPNPTSNNVTITLTGANGLATITVLDLKGSVILEKNTYKNNEVIDLSKVENGIYFIQVKSNNSTLTKKIIVTK